MTGSAQNKSIKDLLASAAGGRGGAVRGGAPPPAAAADDDDEMPELESDFEAVAAKK